MALAIFSFSNCKKTIKNSVMSDNLRQYIYAYSGGTISRAEKIKIKLTFPPNISKKGEPIPNGILEINPSVKGVAVWEDETSISFKPEVWLKSGTSYNVSLNLKKLYGEVTPGAEKFSFQTETKKLDYEILQDGFALSSSDKNIQSLKGIIHTSDLVRKGDLSGMISAKFDGKNLDVEINGNEEGDQFGFLVKNIQRTERSAKLEVFGDGKKWGVSSHKKFEIQVPSLKDFQLVEATPGEEDEQYVNLFFSDPIDPNQTLNGLIRVDTMVGDYKFAVDGFKVKVYTPRRVSGNRLIIVDPGIRNADGKSMALRSEYTINFPDINPEVRLLGKGVILPDGVAFKLPFEAKNLNAVDVEVFKIFNNNILLFLQSNELNEYESLERVGRVVWHGKVSLDHKNSWTRYALDLNKMVAQDPTAIYQVRIGFRASYAKVSCDQSNISKNNVQEDPNFPLGMDENYESFMDDYYGPEGYFDDYSWENRDNPCYKEYYHTERFVRRNLFSSNIGLIVRQGTDRSIFGVATDLKTSEPMSGVKMEFFDAQLQSLGTFDTNSEGIVEGNIPKGIPFAVVATKGNERAYLRMTDGSSILTSSFDVEGVAPQKGLKGFIYSERGVWRPGDTMHLDFVLNDIQSTLPQNQPILLEITDARGQLYHRSIQPKPQGGITYFPVALRGDVPTGKWSATLKVGGGVFTKSLLVETVKPNRLKVNLEFPKKELTESVERGTLNASWLTGLNAGSLKANVEATFKVGVTEFPKFKDYSFTDPARMGNFGTSVIFDGNLSSEGKSNISLSLPKSNCPGKMMVNLQTKVFEPGGEFSSDYQTISYSPFQTYIGIQTPKNKYGEPRLDEGKPGILKVASLTAQGNPQSNKSVQVIVYKVNWRWWWDTDENDLAGFQEGTGYTQVLNTKTVTGSNGLSTVNFTPSTWGRYFIRVCDEDGGHCSGTFVYAGYPYQEDGDNIQGRQQAAMLPFAADKEVYQIGETVSLKIPETKAGRVLVTLETGTKVIRHFWKEAKEGESILSFKVEEDMAPNVYAHLTLIQPHAQAINDQPIRLFGIIPIKVENKNSHIVPKIIMPDVLKPEQKFSVEVKESSGKAMSYTLAIVDEGLLDLTRFKTPNAHEYFFAREALGVKSWDIYDYVLGVFGAGLERVLSIGGDGFGTHGNNANKNPMANRFKPVSMHLGPFTLAQGATGKHSITLPNYVGSVRVMVVASGNNSYGSTDKTVPVKKALMVSASIPRVLSPGETFRLPVTVFALESKVKNVNLKFSESAGLLLLTSQGEKNLQFSKVGDQISYFEVKAANKEGIAKIKIQGVGGGESAYEEIEVDIRNPNPIIVQSNEILVAPGKSMNTNIAPIGSGGSNSATIEVSSLPPLDLEKRLKYLIEYPYGCVEQTTSGAFAQLYLDKLVDLNNEQISKTKTNISAAISSLQKFQTNEGGLGYWPGDQIASGWGTTYAGHFLLEAKKAGYSVPDQFLSKWMSFQKALAQKWDPILMATDYGERADLEQAYRLFTLALGRSPELGAMNRLRESKNLSLTASWQLAAAYAMAGKNEIANKMVQGLSSSPKPYLETGGTYGSDSRDRALMLQTTVLLKDSKRSNQLAREVSKDLSSSGWYSTQTLAQSMVAMAAFAAQNPIQSNMTFQYKLGSKASFVNAASSKPIFQFQIPGGSLSGLQLKNTGKGQLYVRIIKKGKPNTGEIVESIAENLVMSTEFTDTKGNKLDISNLKQGMDFFVKVNVSNPDSKGTDYKELALTQVFPSGWQIVSKTDSENGSYDYRDIRDDRVHTFFDLNRRESKTFIVRLNATYVGQFFKPPFLCEAMYDSSIRASGKGEWIRVGSDLK
jgi:alpha-2-macroglobulin